MTGTVALRQALTGLLSFAAAEEQILLAPHANSDITKSDNPGSDIPGSGSGSASWDITKSDSRGSDGPGSDSRGSDSRGSDITGESGGEGPDRWAAGPVVAHNNQFKSEQAERVRCVLAGQVPVAYGEVDHSSAEVYRGYCAQPTSEVMAGCRRVSAELIDGTWALADEDLLDPARNPWLNGRLLWLQIVVRGFWHATGHLGDYYLAHGQPERAVALQAHGLATARYLGVPAPAAGMAGYSLACAQARAGRPEEAAATLAEAIAANPDLRANARRDRDLSSLREAGLLRV